MGASSPTHLVPTIAVGDPVSQGQVIFNGAVVAATAHVSEPGDPASQTESGLALVGEVSGINVNYTTGSGSLDKATSLKLAELGISFSLTVRLAHPVRGFGVPIGAVVTGPRGACVATDANGHTVPVTVLAADIGVAILGTLPAHEVVANPWTLGNPPECI